jgi:menaquinone-dependent protoporphyrinogen oxidase
MTNVSVVYASRHGATREIAERIAETLRSEGLQARAIDAREPLDPGAEAHVIGSAVYIGAWLKDARAFVADNAAALANQPVWLFSSGPLATPGAGPDREAVNATLLQQLKDEVSPRDHAVFGGVYDSTSPPMAISERLVRLMPASRELLRDGDFRDWPAIEDWSRQIAAELSSALVTVS